MGLITPTDPTNVTNVVVKTYPQTVTVTRVCTDGSSSSGITDSGSIDKTLYRVFSMQDDMKILQVPVRIRNEFDLFVKYAEAKTAGNAYDSRFDQLDSYLGSIGISNEMCKG